MTTIVPTFRDLKVRSPLVPQAQALPAPSNEFFPRDVQRDLAQSDHEAWTAICSILITIVSLGLVIGIGTVLLTF